jgi:SRSO17 transposase
MQLTRTIYSKELLDKWRDEEISAHKITGLLAQYVRSYDAVITNKTQRIHFENYLRGLMSSLDRKSVEPIALSTVGEKGVRPLQQFITRSTLADAVVLGEYHSMFGAATASENGMLSVDGSDFPKKGKNSAGVTRQYCGSIGKTENCQAGVFCAYAGGNGYGFVDRALYLPKNWFTDEYNDLRSKCEIPEDMIFRTKNEIALTMLQEAVRNGKFKVKWIGCDSAFGCDHSFIDALPGGVWYFAGVKSDELVFLSMPEMKIPDPPPSGRKPKHETPSFAPVQVKTIAFDDSVPWKRVLLFDGAKGGVYADFKCLRCVSCRTKTKFGNYVRPHTEVWLYMRRYENGEIKYFLSNAPGEVALQELHEAATLRWPIEQCFRECKSYLGMDHFEGRSYPGFLRHLLFVMIAHFFVTNLRLELKKTVCQ